LKEGQGWNIVAVGSHEEQHWISEAKLFHSSSVVLCHSKRKRVGTRPTAHTRVVSILSDIFYLILVYVYRLRDGLTIFMHSLTKNWGA
jgi:aromatic ring-cleaving dioxygenase